MSEAAAVDALSTFFSHVCGQARCFVCDGLPLPVCQRCLGLYAGAALTTVWLVASGLWRRGLPPRSIVLLHIGLLLNALLGGLRIVDTGTSWRMWCGLATGHVVLFWLAGGARQLWLAACKRAALASSWSRGARIQCAMALLILVPLAFAPTRLPSRTLWSVLALLGATCLAVAVSAAGALLAYTVSCLMPRAPSPACGH